MVALLEVKDHDLVVLAQHRAIPLVRRQAQPSAFARITESLIFVDADRLVRHTLVKLG